MNNSRGKTIKILVATIYLAIALFGMGALIIPAEHGNMLGGGCPLMGDTGSLCQMGILDRITHWNLLFAAVSTGFVFFVAMIVAFTVPVRAKVQLSPHERLRRYTKANPHVRLFQTTIRLFSDGILQPKVFA